MNPNWFRGEVSVPVWQEMTPTLRDDTEARIKKALEAEFGSHVTIHEFEVEED